MSTHVTRMSRPARCLQGAFTPPGKGVRGGKLILRSVLYQLPPVMHQISTRAWRKQRKQQQAPVRRVHVCSRVSCSQTWPPPCRLRGKTRPRRPCCCSCSGTAREPCSTVSVARVGRAGCHHVVEWSTQRTRRERNKGSQGWQRLRGTARIVQQGNYKYDTMRWQRGETRSTDR